MIFAFLEDSKIKKNIENIKNDFMKFYCVNECCANEMSQCLNCTFISKHCMRANLHWSKSGAALYLCLFLILILIFNHRSSLKWLIG